MPEDISEQYCVISAALTQTFCIKDMKNIWVVIFDVQIFQVSGYSKNYLSVAMGIG